MAGKRIFAYHKISITLIPVCVALIYFLSCGDTKVMRNVAAADSLTEVNQQEAVRYIDSVARADKGMSRNGRMKLLLLRMKALNKLDCPLDTDTLASLVKYFDRHGSANDRMLANYILGCYYIGKGNSPEAMRYLHLAAEAADTTDAGCDWRTLHKVHVHTALQLMAKNALTDAMTENALALKFAMAAKDTLNAIITLEQRSNIYLNQGQDAKAFDIRSKLYGMYKNHGYDKEAAISVWPLVSMLAKRGNLAAAKRCIGIFEKESGLVDSIGNIEKGREAYYVDKGIYMFKLNKIDSAEYYFRKCLGNTNSHFNCKDSYEGLEDVYKKRHIPDSVAKYAELARITTDSMYAEMKTTHLQQMRAMYNYNEYKLSAEVYKRKALSARLTTIIIALVVSILAICAAIYIRKKRRARRMEVIKYERSIAELEKARLELYTVNEKQQAEMARMIKEKTNEIERQRKTDESYIHELERSRDELHDLSERQKVEFNRLIEAKDAQIDQLYQEKQKYEKVKTRMDNINKYSDKPIVKQLKHHAKHDFTPMTKEEISRLKELFAGEEGFSKIDNIVNEYEYQVCMLIRTGFTPSDICILMNSSKSSIANVRKKLYTKLTGRNGSSKDFDVYINSL